MVTEQTLAERLHSIFEHLHRNPEVSWGEVETTAFIADFLRKEGFEPNTFENMTGLYVDIGEGTPMVGFRTDIDALWQEVDGQFRANHSCGHDGHMTMALGTILLLKELAPTLTGAVRIIFQPAEEKAQGAKALVEEGVVDSLHYLFGTHVRPHFELQDGTYAPALYHGAAKLLTGTIKGVEAHGSRPEKGVNAIEAAAALIDGLKRVWISPAETASIKMTQLQAGGTSTNIIPGKATFGIDARAQNNETMEALTAGFEKVITAVSMMYGATIDYQVDAHIAAAQVDETAKAIMQQAIIDVAGKEHLAPEIVTPGGEDFHFYAYKRPKLKTTMLGLGCGVTPGLHHPHMTFNQKRLPKGAQIITRALVLALHQVERSENQ
ncbi:M20 peptidase aminoacylase family protein [Paenibacillus sp. BSR1-1]|uniref:M20 peptidase aminoacylase family protein n=1 Tax=Paenibacillus sp. BSR1-1 TaxID=3020845 RepID=UPI0025AF09AF|nr:M20 peptidase aminoacylase family protein [Paenibacillus sp. BSR1-1]MDN3014669.1 M20 peptidase aminoacylase family protein [Paenibacillus sp. BSR1-1]